MFVCAGVRTALFFRKTCRTKLYFIIFGSLLWTPQSNLFKLQSQYFTFASILCRLSVRRGSAIVVWIYFAFDGSFRVEKEHSLVRFARVGSGSCAIRRAAKSSSVPARVHNGLFIALVVQFYSVLNIRQCMC